MISSAFDPFMGIYVQKEDQIMREAIERIISEEVWSVDDDERNKVLTSSTDLFFYIKESMKLCTTLSKSLTFFEIYKVYKKHLSTYCKALTNKVPRVGAILSEKDEKTLCLVINTTEYCAKTVLGLTETIKKLIDPKFIDQIDMKDEQVQFEQTNSQALNSLLTCLNNKVETAFAQMAKMNWASWDSVGDQSDYVNQIANFVGQSVPIYNNWLTNPSHFRYFCSEFVGLVVPSLISYLYKCKKISEVGAQQLMLDFTAIKSILENLPNVGKKEPGPPNQRQARLVNKHMGKSDHILKVILSPFVTLAETFRALIPDGTDSDLQKIMDIKGLSRTEQKVVMENFHNSNKESAPQSKAATNFRKLFTDVTAALNFGKDEDTND